LTSGRPASTFRPSCSTTRRTRRGESPMSPSPQEIERLPYVEGVLNYLALMAEKPYNLAYDPAPGTPRSNGRPEAHTVAIRDMRPIAGRLDFDREGIGFVGAPTAQRDFYNDDELRRVYYPECIELVLAATGGIRGQVFDHTIRRGVWGGEGRIGSPACRASR